MDDLIKRKEAMEVLEFSAELLRRVLDTTDFVGIERGKLSWGLGLIESCIADMESVSSADAVPVVHGEWQEENRRPRSSIFYCSICHRTAYDIQPTRDKAWKKRCRYAYCPHCGAKMDGKGGDGNG